MTITPDLADILLKFMEERVGEVYTSIPGRVEVYDEAGQVADVTPMVRTAKRDSVGNDIIETFPILPEIPVMWPRAGGYFITFPLKVGDFVMIQFCMRDIADFLAKGVEVTPSNYAYHPFGSAVCIPGVFPNRDRLSERNIENDMVMGKESGAQIRIRDDGVVIVGKDQETVDAVALATAVADELTKVINDVNSLKTVFSTWVTVPNDGGAALKLAATTWYGSTIQPVGKIDSEKVFVEE
jgi:hypothetical protein